jgi:transposase
MLSLGAQRIYLYHGAADMRKSFNGLGALVEAAFEGQLLTGAYFVFVNRRQTLVKILYWDADGFAVWCKRLEQGTFKIAKNSDPVISKRDLTLLLEGVEPKRMNRRFSPKK